jgi:hypothetical protein
MNDIGNILLTVTLYAVFMGLPLFTIIRALYTIYKTIKESKQ